MKNKNILLLFTDQQRFDTIQALGNEIIKTPAMDSLVENGIAFTRAYSPCPVCIPARYAMHTGKMPHKTGCAVNEKMPEGRSFMQVLAENGYQTHGIGKMHFAFKDEGARAMWGYETRDISEEFGTTDIGYDKFVEEHGYGHVKDLHGIRSDMYYIPQPSQFPEELHHTTWVTDRSVAFLERRDKNRPFFLMSSFIKPHPPFESPVPWNKLYRGPEMPLPKRPHNVDSLLTFWNRFQNSYKFRDQGIDDNLIRTMKAAYYSCISFVDYNIGRLLAYMDEAGLMDNTLILLSADHGELLGDYDSFGKRSFLDSAARIPMIMRHPDLPKGMKCSKPVSLVDIFPTLIQYAGVVRQEDCSGESLIDIAMDRCDRDIVYGQYHRNEKATYMAVTEEFKYIYSAADQKEILFDYKADPQETKNCASNPLYVKKTRAMKKRIIEYFKAEGYLEPIDGDNWRENPIQTLPDGDDSCILFQDPESSIPHITGYQRDFNVECCHVFRNGF